jgi:hypothetical protein
MNRSLSAIAICGAAALFGCGDAPRTTEEPPIRRVIEEPSIPLKRAQEDIVNLKRELKELREEYDKSNDELSKKVQELYDWKYGYRRYGSTFEE